MEYGIVYLLTNPVMPGLVKIGMTTQEDIDKRMKELYTTGVPVPFVPQEFLFRLSVNLRARLRKVIVSKLKKPYIKPLILSASIRIVSSSVLTWIRHKQSSNFSIMKM